MYGLEEGKEDDADGVLEGDFAHAVEFEEKEDGECEQGDAVEVVVGLLVGFRKDHVESEG